MQTASCGSVKKPIYEKISVQKDGLCDRYRISAVAGSGDTGCAI